MTDQHHADCHFVFHQVATQRQMTQAGHRMTHWTATCQRNLFLILNLNLKMLAAKILACMESQRSAL